MITGSRVLEFLRADKHTEKCSSVIPGLPGAICEYFAVLFLSCKLFSVSFPILWTVHLSCLKTNVLCWQ
jgi:hypothetical protein